jgi:hypothetical protein
MDYVSLLSTTVRFIDLHDSGRDYGGSANYNQETRTGKSDGVYLDIAILIVECLHKLDQSTHQEYLPFSSILNSVRIDRPDVVDLDVLYVLNVLRRPTEIFYVKRATNDSEEKLRQSEKRKTAIVEKTDYADEYRISASGRLFLSLANAAHDTAYVRGNAYNLLHAIELHDFPNVLVFANEIIGQLRNEILDVRGALERVGRTENIDKYISKFEQYRKVIEETISIAQKAERELEKSDTLVAFEISNLDISFGELCGSVNRVRQVLVIFNRLISELVSTALQDRRNATLPPQFLNAAIDFVRNPLKAHNEDFILKQWGAVGLETPFHSALDGMAAIKIRPTPEKAETVIFENEQVEPISRLGKLHFLDCYGSAIVEALKLGPLRLSEAINNGWFMVNERMLLGDLVGIFVAPDVLPVNGNIQIHVIPTFNTQKVGVDDFLFNDIEIRIAGESCE